MKYSQSTLYSNQITDVLCSFIFIIIFTDSPEEGEIRPPKRRKIPRRSPPPEDEWAPCIRMLVSESSSLAKGTLFVVTQDGANIGR